MLVHATMYIVYFSVHSTCNFLSTLRIGCSRCCSESWNSFIDMAGTRTSLIWQVCSGHEYFRRMHGALPPIRTFVNQLCALLARSYHSSSIAPPGACARRRLTAIRDGTSSLSATATLWRAAIRISLDPFGTFMRPLPKPDGETDMVHNAQHVQRTHTLSVEDWIGF